MKDIEKNDIDFINDQVKYLDSLRNKIFDDGKVILVTSDADVLEKLIQTLASFKILLIAIRSQK
jgi:hypothetical protein